MSIKALPEKARTRYARRTGERAAVDLINAGYNVKIRRTNQGNIYLIAFYKRSIKRGKHLRNCIFRF